MSQAVFPNSVRNVRSWVKSGSRFRAAGGLLVAKTRHSGLPNDAALWELRRQSVSRPLSLRHSGAAHVVEPALAERLGSAIDARYFITQPRMSIQRISSQMGSSKRLQLSGTAETKITAQMSAEYFLFCIRGGRRETPAGCAKGWPSGSSGNQKRGFARPCSSQKVSKVSRHIGRPSCGFSRNQGSSAVSRAPAST